MLTVPVIGVARSGWGLEQFRYYATQSLKLSDIDPASPAAVRMISTKPGPDLAPQPRELSYSRPAGEQTMRPYDRLIGAALAGVRYMFARQDKVEAAWRVVQPVLGDVVPLESYPRGSWGPPRAGALAPDAEAWHDPVG